MENDKSIGRREFFNQAADTWDRQYNPPQLTAFLEQLVPSFGLSKGQRVLDLGTGTGLLIPFLLKAVGSEGQVTAVDFAPKMVEKTKEKFHGNPNVDVQVQNVENLQFPSLSFDAVTCFGLFPHIEDKKQALFEIYRVLKSKGTLVIAHALGSQEIRRHHSNSPTVATDVLPSEEEMRKLLSTACFGSIKIVDKPGCYLCCAVKR